MALLGCFNAENTCIMRRFRETATVVCNGVALVLGPTITHVVAVILNGSLFRVDTDTGTAANG